MSTNKLTHLALISQGILHVLGNRIIQEVIVNKVLSRLAIAKLKGKVRLFIFFLLPLVGCDDVFVVTYHYVFDSIWLIKTMHGPGLKVDSWWERIVTIRKGIKVLIPLNTTFFVAIFG